MLSTAKKQLGHAVKPGGIGVHVRFRRRGGAVELEQVVQELYGLFGEGSQLPRFRRKRRFGGFGLLFVRVWRFRQKRGRRPKPPSLEKAPARLRALDADSFGSAPSLYIKGAIYPSRAN